MNFLEKITINRECKKYFQAKLSKITDTLLKSESAKKGIDLELNNLAILDKSNVKDKAKVVDFYNKYLIESISKFKQNVEICKQILTEVKDYLSEHNGKKKYFEKITNFEKTISNYESDFLNLYSKFKNLSIIEQNKKQLIEDEFSKVIKSLSIETNNPIEVEETAAND